MGLDFLVSGSFVVIEFYRPIDFLALSIFKLWDVVKITIDIRSKIIIKKLP